MNCGSQMNLLMIIADCECKPAAKKTGKYWCKRFHCYKTWYGVFDMRFSTFLKDKWIFLLSQTGIILFLALLLNVMKISNAANALVCICVLFITVGALVLEYNQKNGFYRELYRNLETLEKKYYISSVMEKPGFVEGTILMDVLRQTTKSMNDDIADYRRMNTEYQDYVETWIHEIKIRFPVLI